MPPLRVVARSETLSGEMARHGRHHGRPRITAMRARSRRWCAAGTPGRSTEWNRIRRREGPREAGDHRPLRRVHPSRPGPPRVHEPAGRAGRRIGGGGSRRCAPLRADPAAAAMVAPDDPRADRRHGDHPGRHAAAAGLSGPARRRHGQAAGRRRRAREPRPQPAYRGRRAAARARRLHGAGARPPLAARRHARATRTRRAT